MGAQPTSEPDPLDPAELLRVLPDAYHEQFLAEYADAGDSARRPADLLRLWRLRAER